LSSIEGSGFSQIQRLFQFRIKTDADLLQAISEAVSAEEIRAGVFVSGVSFAAAHADGRPQRALPQKPKLESLNLRVTNLM